MMLKILVVIIIGLIVVLVFKSNNAPIPVRKINPIYKPSTVQTSNLDTYQFKDHNFSFQYPNQFTLIAKKPDSTLATGDYSVDFQNNSPNQGDLNVPLM